MEGYQIVASRSQSLKLWTSYGFGTNLLAYLSPLEQIQLQVVNQFAYNILICRVLTKLSLPTQTFLSLWFCEEGPLDGKILRINNNREIDLIDVREQRKVPAS